MFAQLQLAEAILRTSFVIAPISAQGVARWPGSDLRFASD